MLTYNYSHPDEVDAMEEDDDDDDEDVPPEMPRQPRYVTNGER